MTFKEELLNYIDGSINQLITYEFIIGTDKSGRRTWDMSKTKTISYITDYFNDELVGQLPNDYRIQITGWE